MKYFLPLIINNERRIHIAHLTEGESKNKNHHFFEFIIHNTGGESILFKIVKDAKFVFSNNTTNDLFLKDYNCTYENGILKFDFKEGNSNKTINETGVFVRNDNGDITVGVNRYFTSNKIILKILLETSEYYYYYEAIFHIVNKKDIFIEAGLDFGSEASQMAYKNISNHGDITRINILKELKNEFYSFKDLDLIRFYQFEKPEGNYPLFKSFFTAYVGKKLTDLRVWKKPAEEEKNFIDSITKTNVDLKKEKLIVLPNFKQMQMQGYVSGLDYNVCQKDAENKTPLKGKTLPLSDYKNYFLRYLLNHLLHVLFKKVSYSNEKRFVKLKLLVPNVYPQNKIYDIIRNLYEDYNSIISEYRYNISGFEVETISESDASYLGLFFKNDSIADDLKINVSPNKLFLLVDGGKGTIDFTILKISELFNEFESKYRDGIPGSGQIINYAIMQIFYDFFNTYGINLNDYIDEFNSADKLIFVNAIEQIKINCSITNEKDLEKDKDNFIDIKKIIEDTTENIEDKILKVIDAYGKRKINLPDPNNRVASAIEELTEQLVKKINNFKNLHNETNNEVFYQIILSGRAFKFKPLYNTLIKKLAQFSNNIIYNKSLAKSACLDGAFSTDFYKINLNSLLIGYPNITKMNGKMISSHNSNEYSLMNNELYSPANCFVKNKNNDNNLSVVDRIVIFFKHLFKGNSNSQNTNKNISESIDINERFFFCGYDFDVKNNLNLFLSLPGEKFSINKKFKKGNIFFTEDGFVLRNDYTNFELISQKAFYFEELINFSNYPISNSNRDLSKDFNDDIINKKIDKDIFIPDIDDIKTNEEKNKNNVVEINEEIDSEPNKY